MYIGPEEVMVLAKIHPIENLGVEELTRAMDDLVGKIRHQPAIVADVFIDVTTSRSADNKPVP